MKKYEAYKDSGIEWIGEIPKEWSILRMKHYFYMKGRIGWQGLKADEFIEDGPYLVTGTDFVNGKVCWERCYHISEERFNEAPEIHVQQGDLLITKDGTVGKLALIEEKPEKVSLNSHLLILRPVKGEINNHFVYWALQSVIFKDYVGLASSGSTMASLSQEKIGEFPLILPTLSEQQIIVSYLDHKIGKIDASVSAINSQIDDLKAYRQSIISETVTKGLNPDVKMKDSGVEWIGEIPEMWKCTKLGWLYPNMGSGTTPDTNNLNYYSEGGYNWLQTGDLNDGVITDTSKHITELAVNERGMRIYPSGSVVVAMYGATIGKVGLLSIDTTTNQACCVLPITENIYNRYTFYVMQSSKMSLISKSVGGGQPNISQTIIKEHKIPVPPLHEQQAIASYLDSKTSKIDSVIKSLEVQLNDLNALKQSIISEAVTGKIDLREWKQSVEQ